MHRTFLALWLLLVSSALPSWCLGQTAPPPPPDPDEAPATPPQEPSASPVAAFPPPPPDGPPVPYNYYPSRLSRPQSLPEAPLETSPTEEVRPDPSPGTRYALEALAGLGVGAGLALGGGIVGLGLGAASASRSRGISVSGAASIIALSSLGYFFGVPWGVRLVGNARGGNGGYGWSLLGTLLGGMAAGLVSIPLNEASRSSEAIAVVGPVLVLTLMVGGAVVGYELSNDQHSLPRRRARAAPTLGLCPTTNGLQLVGTF
ncbi:MAG: hypothetical protein HY909_08530 [Deltaproteobacteria bacterium]|nr:hypothetical protein [Deltaproteobacteria bacterium]